MAHRCGVENCEPGKTDRFLGERGRRVGRRLRVRAPLIRVGLTVFAKEDQQNDWPDQWDQRDQRPPTGAARVMEPADRDAPVRQQHSQEPQVVEPDRDGRRIVRLRADKNEQYFEDERATEG